MASSNLDKHRKSGMDYYGLPLSDPYQEEALAAWRSCAIGVSALVMWIVLVVVWVSSSSLLCKWLEIPLTKLLIHPNGRFVQHLYLLFVLCFSALIVKKIFSRND